MIGDSKNATVSNYRPSDDVAKFTKYVKDDYQIGYNILTKTWNELNNSSVIDDMNRGRRMFNAFVDESVEDVAEAWKWRGTRSKARNKGIGMHANLTAGYLIPTFRAQNEDQDEDRGFSEFMSDLVEWMATDPSSDYMPNFLNLVFAVESDPIVWLGAEYQKVMQEIKIKGEDGRYMKHEILDEVLSGFKAPIYTAEQVLVTNAFERDTQKQTCVGKRRWITYENAEARYGTHENWAHVKPGVTTFMGDDGLFYESTDVDHPNMVEEYTPMYRRKDTETCFLGGVYMGNADVEQNPMRHRDNFGAPRYNIQHFGYYPIGSHFLFYKSMMNSMRWDNALYDAMSEIGMNRAILDAESPLAISGTDAIDQGVIYPNAVVAFKDKETKVQNLLQPSNLGNLFGALAQTDESISEGTINETQMGQLPPASQKAFTVAQAQANAKKIIGGVAKGIAFSISKYALLMGDIAIHNLSIPETDEITGDTTKLKYRKFILENKNVNGKRVAKMLMFDDKLLGKEMTEEEATDYSLSLLPKKPLNEIDKYVYVANPQLFARMKYLAKADYKELFPQDDTTMQALITNLWAMLKDDPMIEREALLREVMYSYFKGKGEKFINQNPQPLPAPGQTGPQPSPVSTAQTPSPTSLTVQ